MTFTLPGRLVASCRDRPERSAWLSRLAGTLRDLERRWSLTVGAPFDDEDVSCAWVAPVTLATGASAVLKLGMPHMEAEHEIEGLRWPELRAMPKEAWTGVNSNPPHTQRRTVAQ